MGAAIAFYRAFCKVVSISSLQQRYQNAKFDPAVGPGYGSSICGAVVEFPRASVTRR